MTLVFCISFQDKERMSTLCRNVQEAIEESVYEPVKSWVNKQSEKCKRKKWCNPASWFCWLIWILVKVVTWILITVITRVTKVVCTLVSFVAHIVLVAVGSIIDAFCEDCHIVDFANSTFGSEGKCKLEGKTPSVDKPKHFHCVFICKCKKRSFQNYCNCYE